MLQKKPANKKSEFSADHFETQNSYEYSDEYSAEWAEYLFCPDFRSISLNSTRFLIEPEYSDEYSFE